MGVVTVPGSASRAAAFVSRRRSSSTGRSISVVAFKTDRTKCSATAILTQFKPITIPSEEDRPVKKPTKKKQVKQPKREKGTDLQLDYNEVAAALENLYKISPCNDYVVRSSNNRKRMRRNKEGEIKCNYNFSREDDDQIEKLVREYSISSMDLVSMDWKRMKMLLVLSSREHDQLFKLMQPMKVIFEVKENLHKDLNKEPTEGELATSMNVIVPQLRRHMEVSQAARNKLIKHNLRLVPYAINKYYQEMENGDNFQDLCQAGVKGLITAIDRFESKHGFHLSTYTISSGSSFQ